MVLDAIEVKFGSCPEHIRTRITQSTDRAILKRLVRIIMTAENITELDSVELWN
jgi:hypothetical protein